jgi:hypothetical protein
MITAEILRNGDNGELVLHASNETELYALYAWHQKNEAELSNLKNLKITISTNIKKIPIISTET